MTLGTYKGPLTRAIRLDVNEVLEDVDAACEALRLTMVADELAEIEGGTVSGRLTIESVQDALVRMAQGLLDEATDLRLRLLDKG